MLLLNDVTMQQKERKQGETGRREEEEEEEEERKKGLGKDRRRGDGEGRRRREKVVRSRRAASEGGEGREGGEGGGDKSRRLRVHQLEEQLELKAGHNQEVTRLQAQVTRLRCWVERGEAQGAELKYQLTLSQRDAARAAGLTAELQQEVQELQKALEDQHALQQEVKKLQKALDVTQHALQQEVQERDRLIDSFSSEKHRLLQHHQEALEEVQKKRDEEAEINRRQAGELKHLEENEERSRREKEALEQRMKFLEASVKAERASHLETKVASEVMQLRGRDLETAVLVERSGLQEAQHGLQLLEERLRGSSGALQRLQREYDQCKSDLSVALKTERTTTSDLSERLEEEKRQHANTHTLLEQEAQRRRDAEECLNHMRDTLQLHTCTGASPAAKHAGKQSPAPDVLQLLQSTLLSERLRLHAADKQVLDLLLASETLHQHNQDLTQLTSDQRLQLQESQEEVRRLHQESSDWSTMSRGLQAELEREKEERGKEREEKERETRREMEEKEREKEERAREKETEKEEREREVQKITDHHQEESKARLSFLYLLYQRLLAGCVLLDQPQSILGDFTWTELCDVITEQLDRLTSDLRRANGKIAQLQRVCDKKSVCVRELQRSQECVLSRVEESVRRREEAQSSRHTHTVTRLQRELQLSLSQSASLTSSLSLSRGESSSLLSACALLGGALRHAALRLSSLCLQKALLSRRLEEREALEEEVRRLAGALGGEEEEEEGEEERKRRRSAAAVRRWRSSVCAVLAVRRWSALTRRSTVLFHLQGGGAVCGGVATATEEGQEEPSSDDDDDDGGEGACARWLRSKVLSSIILSSMSDLQGALTHTGSAPPDVMSAARSALSRLLDRLLDQSDAAPHRLDEDTLIGRLRLGLRRTPPRPNTKALVSSLQQHFLVLSQRLHSAEVERRSLRLDVANQKRQERDDACRTVPVHRFHSVCEELRQALSREHEAQSLLQDQTERLHALQRSGDAHAATQRTLKHTTQSLLEARQEVSRKERSLRVLGKHLSAVQKERRQLEERQKRMEDELGDATRRKDYLISNMKAAETSYKEVRESLVQSHRSPSTLPRPLPLPREHLELSGAESIMGAPEVAACQLAEFPETFPFADVGAPQPVPVSDLSKEPPVCISPAPSQTNPAPRLALSKPLKSPKTRERKAAKKSRGGRR